MAAIHLDGLPLGFAFARTEMRARGGPHALACGALIPERVAGIVLDSSSAPFDLLGERAFDGMNAVNRAGYVRFLAMARSRRAIASVRLFISKPC